MSGGRFIRHRCRFGGEGIRFEIGGGIDADVRTRTGFFDG